MAFPFSINIHNTKIPACPVFPFWVRGPLVTLVGPNGSGKTQLMRALKNSLQSHSSAKKVRFLSAGRMGQFEEHRSIRDARYGSEPNYGSASIGDKGGMEYRHTSETSMGDFYTLDARPDIQIKISERLRKLFHREVFLEWDGGQLKAYFAPEGNIKEKYTSAQEASGLLHLVSLLAALYDDEVGILLLDEPEVSLHPQLQAFVLQEMKRVAGDPSIPGKKIIIMATHSSIMIDVRKPADLCSFAFCTSVKKAPIQIDPQAGELKAAKVKELVARLGQEHKNAFFALRPLLVEGSSDMILAKALDQKCEIYLEPAGTQIVPILGKGETSAVCKLFRLMGKKPVAILDADAFTDSEDLAKCFVELPEAIQAAQDLGHSDLKSFLHDVYADFCSAVITNWDALLPLVSHHPSCKTDDKGVYTDKAQKRSVFSVVLATESFACWPNSATWSPLKTRINVLLDVLGCAGCFFLRKGAIEQYYQSETARAEGAKPTASVAESEYIQDIPISDVEAFYRDFLVGLRFAGKQVSLDETGELRNYLIAAAGPIINNEKNGTKEEPNSLAHRLIKEKSTLFKFKVENSNLQVELESKIMNVSGFPLSIPVNSDPGPLITQQIVPSKV